jgi:hypothetical protein
VVNVLEAEIAMMRESYSARNRHTVLDSLGSSSVPSQVSVILDSLSDAI